jgi:hypothetical protein
VERLGSIGVCLKQVDAIVRSRLEKGKVGRLDAHVEAVKLRDTSVTTEHTWGKHGTWYESNDSWPLGQVLRAFPQHDGQPMLLMYGVQALVARELHQQRTPSRPSKG